MVRGGPARATLEPTTLEKVRAFNLSGRLQSCASIEENIAASWSFDVAQDDVVSFYCHGPRYGWPQLLAALVKNDLWITPHRE